MTGRLLFPGVVAIAALLIARLVLCEAPLTTDENSYVFQAHAFCDGLIARPSPPFPVSFKHKMIILDDEVGWLSRYPPGHSLWLVPGVLAGHTHLSVAAGAAISVWALATAAAHLGASGLAACVLILASPFFLLVHGTLLSHTSGFLAVALFLVAYVHWRRWLGTAAALAAGAAWSWLVLNRTLTALCLVIPIGFDVLTTLWRERSRSRLFGTGAFVAACATGLGLLLVYNFLAVGSPWTMTYLYYDPSEGLGFGTRHTVGLAVEHTPATGIRNVVANLVLLDRWLWGFPGSLIVCIALMAWGTGAGWRILLFGAPLSIWAGHVFFWYAGWSQTGPIYFFESVPFLVLGASLGVSRFGRFGFRSGTTRLAAAGVVTGLFAVSGFFLYGVARDLSPEACERAAVLEAVRAAPPRSIVFVGSGPHSDYLALNPRGLDDDPLCVRAAGAVDQSVMRYFSDRTPYRLESGPVPRLVPRTGNESYHETFTAPRLHSMAGDFSRDGDAREALAGRDDAGWIAFGRRSYLFPGRFVVGFDVEREGCARDAVARIEIARCDGTTVLVGRELHARPTRTTEILGVSADGFDCIEPRVFYRGCGNLRVFGIEVREETAPSAFANTGSSERE